jgi:predicted RNase H-like HicB family nuclease
MNRLRAPKLGDSGAHIGQRIGVERNGEEEDSGSGKASHAGKVCGKLSPMTQTFTAVFEAAEEGGYVAFVEEVPGAISQGETLDEARENLKEALALMLEVNRENALAGVNESRIFRETIDIQT